MKKKLIVIGVLMITLLVIGCGNLIPTPIPSSEYHVDIKGDVKTVEFVKNIIENRADILIAREGFTLWIVDISVKNKDYPEPIYSYYSHWAIEGGGSVYRPPKTLTQMLRLLGNAPEDFGVCLVGQTEQMVNVFEVPSGLAFSDAQIVYQGQEPYSYGELTGGSKVVGYDLLLKKDLTASQVYNIATVTNMGVAVDMYSYTMPYLLVVVLKPREAVANQMYAVDLYEKGELRDTATVKWNQPEINVAKEQEVIFRSTSMEFEAYSSEDISHIFSVKVY